MFVTLWMRDTAVLIRNIHIHSSLFIYKYSLKQFPSWIWFIELCKNTQQSQIFQCLSGHELVFCRSPMDFPFTSVNMLLWQTTLQQTHAHSVAIQHDWQWWCEHRRQYTTPSVTEICHNILSVATVFLCGKCGLFLSHKPNLAIINPL